MKCPYPISIKDKYGYLHSVACGQCGACRYNKAKEYAIRIMNELVYYDDATFLTLTYDDDHLPDDLSLSKREFQLFMKRFRRDLGGKKVRFFASGEYGDKGKRRINPHYHVILFGVSPTDDIFKDHKPDKKGFKVKLDSWDKGNCFVGDVTYDSACYVASYTCKKLLAFGNKIPYSKNSYVDMGLLPPFLLMSRRPGIGSHYLENNAERIRRREYLIGKNGKHVAVPRYYRDKLKMMRVGESYARLKQERDEYNKQMHDKTFNRLCAEKLQHAKDVLDNFIENMRTKNEI